MSSRSCGLVVFRRADPDPQILIGHPGGPFWARRDRGAWSIPKGEPSPGEDELAAAIREFVEETGQRLDAGECLDLGTVRQRGGKVVHAWAVEQDLDPESLVSNSVEIQWPPRSGRRISVPEIDRFIWATPDIAADKLNPAQVEFVERLIDRLRQAQP